LLRLVAICRICLLIAPRERTSGDLRYGRNLRDTTLEQGDAALVLGCVPVGLAVVTALKQRGVAPIHAADYSPRRRELALAQGAHTVIDPRAESPYRADALRRAGQVVIFECVGVPGMLDQIFRGAPVNTRIVVVGVCLEMDHSRPLIAVNKELSLQYVLGYTLDEFAATLTHIADGSLDVARLITAEIGLDEVARAFEQLRDPELHAKILVQPWC
jgi:threonine dehydrogenase-like Zn-dependent dehydrogenase